MTREASDEYYTALSQADESVCRTMPSAAPSAVGLTALKATVYVACVYVSRRLSEPFATGVWGPLGAVSY
jgi:hypothetical protein